MRVQLHAVLTCAVAVCLSSALFSSNPLAAQRRPGVGTGFYTTTGLVTGDLEGGSVTSSTSLAEAPTVAVSGLLTAPIKRLPKRAWITGVRLTPLGFGNSGCFVLPGSAACQDLRFQERAALLVGSALDIRSSVLRVMAGPAWYQVQSEGGRTGAAVRVDFAAPRLRGPTPTLFYTGTFLGSQRGESVVMTTLGIGFRFVRKR